MSTIANHVVKNKKLLFLAVGLFFTLIFLSNSFEHPNSGTGGYTGAPGDNVCSSCHSGSSSLTGDITITGLPASVDPSTTYGLTVTINNTNGGADRAGFQIVSLKSDNTNAGTFAIPASEPNGSIKTVAGKSYAGHQPAKDFTANTVVYNVDWTSPASATGNITLYAGAIIANGSGGNSGDEFVNTSIITEIGGGGLPLTGSFSNVLDATCADGMDGSATINATGGSGNYTYSWDNGESAATATMLTPTTHSVTVTDDSSNEIVESVTIGSPDALSTSILFQSDAECNGENSGSAELTTAGGIPNYFYNWGGGITGNAPNNLFAGVYDVTVTDNNNCDENITVIIGEPSAITINTIINDEPSCNGASDGIIAVEATGGVGDFTYNWLDGIGIPNGSTLTDLPAGTYQVEVLDANGCVSNSAITIGEPEAIAPNVSATDVDCNGANTGTATAAPTGGSGTYTYGWSNGGIGATQEDLNAGTYFVTVTDDNECTSVESIDVLEPSTAVTVSAAVISEANCGNTDGILEATASGGVPGYSYSWSNGETGSQISNLASGIYTVTATDDNGCTMETTITLNDADGVSLAANDVINNTCNGGMEGAATISASGSGSTFTYAWSNGGTNATEENLAAGNYTITVTDENDCAGEIMITINEPDAVELSTEEITGISCFGANDGMITVAAAGGTGALTYEWNIGDTDDTIEDLIPGLYSVEVTDENDCTVEFEFIIEEPTEIEGNSAATTPSCNGESNGSITLSPSGGAGDYTYLWTNDSITNTIGNLPAGDYEVTITDGNSCTKIESYTLDDPAEIIATANSTAPTCFDSEDGGLELSVTGGASGYSYVWSTGDSVAVIENIPGGDYSVTIADANGCEIEQSITLVAPSAIDVNATSTNESANGANDGSATADPQNGLPPYSYNWSNGDTTQMISGLNPDTYTVTVTDANGCTNEQTVIVNNGDCNLQADVTITNISCFMEVDGSISVSILNAEETIEYEWSNGESTQEITDLAAGMYSVTATDANNCQIQIIDILIEEPDPITISSLAITGESSSGAMDGAIDIEITGGTGEYSLLLQKENGEQIDISMIGTLSAGDYFIEVTDENGCVSVLGPLTVNLISNTAEIVANQIDLYPVPAQHLLQLKTEISISTTPVLLALDGSNFEIDMTDDTNGYSMDISNITNGVYLLRIHTEEGIALKKVVVAR